MRDKIFIPSRVYDNRHLLEADPYYIANLSLLNEADREALLNGNWDTFSGQVFTEWTDNPEHYAVNDQKYTHVIDDFRIPDSWTIYRGFDFGYAKPFSVGWYAVDHDARIYRIREYYGCTDIPDTGVRLRVQDIAQNIRDIEDNDTNLKGKHIYSIADPSIWDGSRGESIADMMAKYQVYFSPGVNDRIPGKMQYHYRLAFDEIGIPMLYVFRSCKHFIRIIPNLVYSDVRVEDIDTTQEDHIYDECRYVLMEHPINLRRYEPPMPPAEDPLNLYRDSMLDRGQLPRRY